MTNLQEIIRNTPIIAGITAWFIAQGIKVILTFCYEKRIAIERMWGSGGMPSSHSSLVCALTVAVGKSAGFNSEIFAVATVLSFIVMYDATGVRRETGIQAKAINQLFAHTDLKWDEQLKELIGHSPIQVFAGALLGIIVGCFFC
ncbi:MAG: divergent PAP2 family protein [Firmicutes bacterium]|nr:divergent PAP2 family protein [Bacillota bacterium]